MSDTDTDLIAELRHYQQRLNDTREVFNSPDTPMAPMPQTVGIAADRIVALLAERDGLKAKLANLIQKAGDQAATLIIQGGRVEDERNEAAAALVDALGLLREIDDKQCRPVERGWDNWRKHRQHFLAKHGPSP